MSFLTIVKKFSFKKKASDDIKNQSVISSKRISEISFWKVYNEANEQYNHSVQQLTRMSQLDKVRELSEEINLNENYESSIFLEKNKKISKIKSYFLLYTLFSFNEKKYKNGVRNSSDEFIFEDFKNLKFFL